MYHLTFCYGLLLALMSCEAPTNSSTPPTATIQLDTTTTTITDTTQSAPPIQNAVASISDKKPFSFAYQLNEPNKSLALSSRLTEISGLSLLPDDSMLAGVQDEKGNLYLVNKYDGKIETKIDFGRDGDYEGVEIIGNTAYIVNSSGTIYEVQNMNQKEPKIQKYNTFLKSNNDVEGLAYDAAKNRLILACKGRPAKGESLNDLRRKKVCYAFDLQKKELLEQPVFTLTLSAVQQYLKKQPKTKSTESLLELFGPKEKRLVFHPSALAFHPGNQDVYILSSIGKTLMVLDKNGGIKHLAKLRKKIHTQPEGIAFASDGTLYISNEGAGKKAKIHVFTPTKD